LKEYVALRESVERCISRMLLELAKTIVEVGT